MRTSDITDKNKAIMLKALHKTLGKVVTACEEAGVSRSQYYAWLELDEDFAQAVRDQNERNIDIVESVMFDLIVNEKNPQMVMFYLKTKGKGRGYREGMEHTGADGKDLFPQFANQPIQVEVIKTTNE